jgi:hypothetical protein
MTYLYRDATGHLVKVLTDPPTPDAAILAAYRAAIAGPVPDDWQTALAALAALAHAAHNAPVAAQAGRICTECDLGVL